MQSEKIKPSVVEKAKWPFLQPGLEALRTDLREAKGTLMLMLQVHLLAVLVEQTCHTDEAGGEPCCLDTDSYTVRPVVHNSLWYDGALG